MNQRQWTKVAEEFYQKWQFPNCVGAVDEKHIKIRCPPNSGSEYFNYKQYFSIVLLAACDARFKFTWVDIGQYGSISDGGVWSRSRFAIDLEHGYVDLPPPKNLPLTNLPMHRVFVDEAFPLKMYLMRPYNRKDLGDKERVFNYRLARSRRVIENAFGILVSRWQILMRTICCSPDRATNIIKALVCLHNYIMNAEEQRATQYERAYCPYDLIDTTLRITTKF
ncbi:Protein ALP1-like [Formica fusca]